LKSYKVRKMLGEDGKLDLRTFIIQLNYFSSIGMVRKEPFDKVDCDFLEFLITNKIKKSHIHLFAAKYSIIKGMENDG